MQKWSLGRNDNGQEFPKIILPMIILQLKNFPYNWQQIVGKGGVNCLSLWKMGIIRLKLMFKIILGLFAAENLIFAILISLQTGMTYSRRSDVAYKGYAGNVLSCLEVMAWGRAVGLNSKIESLKVTFCCWQMLLQESYFINLFSGAATINLKWFVRRKLNLLKSLIILFLVTSREELRQKICYKSFELFIR